MSTASATALRQVRDRACAPSPPSLTTGFSPAHQSLSRRHQHEP